MSSRRNKQSAGSDLSSWFSQVTGGAGNNANAPKSAAQCAEQKQSTMLGSLAGIFFIILAIIGLLVISWYAGSSGGSLDSSFGNHCYAATEGSSAEGGSCGQSFNSSFDSSNFDDTNAHACPKREGYANCANRRMGDRGTGFGAAGAGADFQRDADMAANAARARGVAFYEPRSPKSASSGKPNYRSFTTKASADEQHAKDVLNKLKKDQTAVMNRIDKAPAAIRQRLNAGRAGFMQMAQSANPNALSEDYIAAGGMISDYTVCDNIPDYPAEYQPQQELQTLTNSPYRLAQSGGISTNPMIANVLGINEGYSRRAALRTGSPTPASVVGQAGMNMVSAMQTQSGQPISDSQFRNMLGKDIASDGRKPDWSTRQKSAYTTPMSPSGSAAISQWNRYTNTGCGSTPGKASPHSNQNAFSLKKKS